MLMEGAPAPLWGLQAGFAALGNLAFRNNNNQEAAAAAGAIVATINALRAHAAHPGVLENAAAALGNICGNANNQVKAVALGALEVLVAAMRAHPSSAGIQENAAAALGNLSANPNNHERAKVCHLSSAGRWLYVAIGLSALTAFLRCCRCVVCWS